MSAAGPRTADRGGTDGDIGFGRVLLLLLWMVLMMLVVVLLLLLMHRTAEGITGGISNVRVAVLGRVSRGSRQLLVTLVGRRQRDRVDETVVTRGRVVLRIVAAQRSVLEEVLRCRQVPWNQTKALTVADTF